MEFLEQHFSLILGFAFAGVFLYQAVRILKKADRIDKEGVETTAVVSRIEEIYDPDTTSSSWTTYVQYRDKKGILRESPVSLTADVQHEVGEQLRIRYMPDDDELVREVKQE